MRGATCGWRREGFHCLQLTQIFRNSRSLCTIPLQIPSLMPLEMRKVQITAFRMGLAQGWHILGSEGKHVDFGEGRVTQALGDGPANVPGGVATSAIIVSFLAFLFLRCWIPHKENSLPKVYLSSNIQAAFTPKITVVTMCLGVFFDHHVLVCASLR